MWHVLLADYIISCSAHSCGLQVTVGHSSVMPDGCVQFIVAVKYSMHVLRQLR